MQRVRRLGIFFIIVCFGSYAGIVAWMLLHEPQFVYFPSRTMTATPTSFGLTYEPVHVRTRDQVKLSGWFVPAPRARATVLLLHGNGGNMGHTLDAVEIYHRLQLNVFTFDYRGYGTSEGTPDEQGTYADAEAAWQYLTERRGLPANTIIVVGHSLGGGVATWLAQQHPPAALVLEATFTSLPDVGAHHYPWIPVRLLSRIRYPSIERIETLNVPILIVHSRDDELIPYQQAEQLFAAASQPKTFLEIQGGHNDGIARSGELYAAGFEAFVRSLPGNP